MLGQTAAAGANDPVLLHTLQQELDRAMSSLSKADPAPYFISYAGNEDFGSVIMASNGALMANIKRHDRTVDVSVRVGSRELDNTHGENRFNAVTTASLAAGRQARRDCARAVDQHRPDVQESRAGIS